MLTDKHKRFLAFFAPSLILLTLWAILSYLSVLPTDGQVCHVDEAKNEEPCSRYILPIAISVWYRNLLNSNEGAVLGLATIAIAWFTLELRRSTDKLGEVSKEAAELAEKQFTLAGRQTDLEEKVHGLTRKQFLATHRPRIVVHTVESATDSVTSGVDTVGALVTYFNVGASAAEIREIRHTITTVKELRPGIVLQPTFYSDKRLSGGQSSDFGVFSDISVSSVVIEDKRDERGFDAETVVCVGVIRYTDDDNIERRTGFCRRYNAGKRTWERIENSDYEYSY